MLIHVLRTASQKSALVNGVAFENVGSIPYDTISKYIDEIVLVDEDEVPAVAIILPVADKTEVKTQI